MKTNIMRLLSLLLILMLVLPWLPFQAAASSPLPNFKIEGSMISWNHPGEVDQSYLQYTFGGLRPNSGSYINQKWLPNIQEYCTVEWTSTGIKINFQEYMEYVSAQYGSTPLEAGTYIVEIEASYGTTAVLGSQSFTFEYTPRSNGVHRIDVEHGTATPPLAKPGTLVGVKAEDKAGHTFDHWQVDSGSVVLKDPNKAVTSFTMPYQDVKLSAVYKETSTLHQVILMGSGVYAYKSEAYAGEKVYIQVLWEVGDYADRFLRWEVVSGGITLDDSESIDTFFIMPDNDVIIRVVYEGDTGPANPFVDVKSDDYFFDPVLWAYTHSPQITDGTDDTHFSPDDGCTRAQVVTFLWRAAGKPAGSAYNPFTDVHAGEYFYEAVLWAVKNGITDGTDDTHFSPNNTCTRGQIVTFLWRFKGRPKPGGGANPFKDVASGQYYTDAVLWAVEHGITDGTDTDKFSPNATCTRGQIVTFLYRADKIPAYVRPLNSLEADDFLIYVEEYYKVTNRGPVITGRVVNGRVDVGDKLRFMTWDPETSAYQEYEVTVEGIEMFHKTLDYAEKGDNIGLLLSGITTDQIQRGSALVDVGTDFQPITGSVKGDLHVYSKEEGGRQNPFFVNYKPQFYYGGATDITATFTDLGGAEMCEPGKDYTGVTVDDLIVPAFWYVGQEITVREGGRSIGVFTVTEIKP